MTCDTWCGVNILPFFLAPYLFQFVSNDVFKIWREKITEIMNQLVTRYSNQIFLLQWFSILTVSSFLAFIAISLTFVCHTESVTQRNHWVGHKNHQKTPSLWLTNDSFVALTQWDKLILRKWQKMPKKETHTLPLNRCPLPLNYWPLKAGYATYRAVVPNGWLFFFWIQNIHYSC